MEEIGIPRLDSGQAEKLCEIAEEAAREHVLSEVPLRMVSDIDITVDIEGLKPITVSVDLEIALSPLMRGCDVQRLACEAAEKAFLAIENHLREIACKSSE